MVRLSDGTAVRLRAVRADDAGMMQDLVRGLSPASRHLRFMMGIRELPENMLARFTQPESKREAVLVAVLPQSDRIIGMAQYAADAADDTCEVAVVVTDDFQRRGLGYRLLADLMSIGADAGIDRVFADILADNHAMRALAQKFGCDIRVNPKAPFLLRVSWRLRSSARSGRHFASSADFAPAGATSLP